MEFHSTLVFFHVLLFVFWLGTDIGVFLAAKLSERGSLSAETRSTLMGLGMVLDRLPRSAVTLIVPSGLQIAVNASLLRVPGPVLPILWITCVLWLLVLWRGFLRPGSSSEKQSHQVNFLMHIVLALLVNGYAVFLLMNSAAPLWLDIKILMVGLILIAGIALDAMFKPAVAAFLDIVTKGATEERNAIYSRAIGPVYTAVLAIYLFVVIAAYMGVAKPAF